MWKEGDVFRWRYTDYDRSMWCKSGIGIVSAKGWLVDTYWYGADNTSFAPDDKSIELRFLGNMSDYDRHPEYAAEEYAAEDCMNLNHANSSRGNFYVKRGARKSGARMLEVLAEQEEKARADIASGEYRLGWIARRRKELTEPAPPARSTSEAAR